MAGNGEQQNDPQAPVTATPDQDEDRLTRDQIEAAKPLELPTADELPDLSQPDDVDAESEGSQSGAGGTGGPELSPDDNSMLIPDAAEPDENSVSTQE